ncbi:XdhC family protein [Cypionkella sp.]|jgi:xanthine dehydrogenase accessory factor|uniref:XdhC family protein n=1 Tax=Cypionkella sp. TaxID=2811411 RepID=UPI002720FB1A|nr:XdhC family protein [Cypionkella sp.]MDO8985607.1 XdhC family protein [Cypionkella sp.]MDP2048727.1 XdhC family protein [Cypionkella sp.]
MRHDLIPEAALGWARGGKAAALATVVETWGSAPRRTGSQMAVSALGEMVGSVSGGCVEGSVVLEAMEAIATGVPRLLSYGVADETAFSAGLACGGTIRVLVEPVAPMLGLLEDLVVARAARRAVGYVVDLGDWSRRLVELGQDAAVDLRLRADKAGVEEGRFILPCNPPLRLVVVGAVHVAQPLVAMARLAGYDPILVDPRQSFATAARFPGEVILEQWPDAALRGLGLDGRTAVVTLTHDPKLDDPAIEVALRSGCFYLGCLGSRKTHAARVGRLIAAGFSEAEIGRIRAPVGLAIGAQGPGEIAVSILAEMTAVLRGG